MDVPGPATPSERRIVSVLFADLVGFTTLAEGLDPEDLATIQDAYFATVREIVGRYRGSLEKFIGDAAMAVFGTPRAEDDDAVRAVQAGLALLHAIGDLGARLGLETQELRLRVGVNTGRGARRDRRPRRRAGERRHGQRRGAPPDRRGAGRDPRGRADRPVDRACGRARARRGPRAEGQGEAGAGVAGRRPPPGTVAGARDGAPAGADARARRRAHPAAIGRAGGVGRDERARPDRRPARGRQDPPGRGARGRAGGRAGGTSSAVAPRPATRRSTRSAA